jgi:broad specificity phosphatase PhoE
MPVPEWHLSDRGRARIAAAAEDPGGWPFGVVRVVTSRERKARETAEILAGPLGVDPLVVEGLEEIDRSATGYVPHDRHEALADACFAHPGASAEGWEPAADAQARIVAAVDRLVRARGDLLIVGHGGIGTLLWCHLSGLAISRRHDQPLGGGCYFAATGVHLRPSHAWRRIEER